MPRLSGGASRDEQGGGETHGHERDDARLRGEPPCDLRPQELLLSRHGEGLPDLRKRESPLHRRRRRDHARRRDEEVHPHQPHPSRGRRGEDQPLRDDLGRRLQPRRDPLDGDRLRARHGVCRRRNRLSDRAKGNACLRGRQRLQPRRGQHALRRQHLDQARRGEEARHEGRDKEHELLQRHTRRARPRGEAPEGVHGPFYPDRAGDAQVGSRGDGDGLDALQGERARLPLFPRTRPRARRA